MEGFRVGTRASRAILFIVSTVVIWYTILFRQNRTDRPLGVNGSTRLFSCSFVFIYK